jgi:hypothetical protein
MLKNESIPLADFFNRIGYDQLTLTLDIDAETADGFPEDVENMCVTMPPACGSRIWLRGGVGGWTASFRLAARGYGHLHGHGVDNAFLPHREPIITQFVPTGECLVLR